VIATAGWLCFSGTTLAADIEATIAACDGCHSADNLGADGSIPAIAGLSEFYHADQLFFYRDEERPCNDASNASGETTNMCASTADLGDEDIEAVAAHYAEMPFVAAAQEFDVALAAAGQEVHERDCEVCHSDGGSNIADDSGILGGQRMGYMEMTFAQYSSGEREQPEQMQKKLDALSDDDVKALLHYYASQQ